MLFNTCTFDVKNLLEEAAYQQNIVLQTYFPYTCMSESVLTINPIQAGPFGGSPGLGGGF